MSRYSTPPGYSGAFAHAAPPAPPPLPDQPKRRSGIGAAALVLALLALVFGWVPVIGLLMMVPASFAILLGLLGVIAGVVSGRTGKVLPFMASVIGMFAFLVPPASTALFALSITPWAYTVGMDQVQIELEHDLKRQGIDSEQAERVSEEVGDVLRSFAKPSRWREGISAAHRFGLACDEYHARLYSLSEDDIEGREAAAEWFRGELERLAERYNADLTGEDLDLISEHIGRDIVKNADNRRQWERRHARQTVRISASGVSVYGQDSDCGSCETDVEAGATTYGGCGDQ